jgi:hypothetical protein
VKIDIDASELLRFTRRLNDLPDAINRAVIDALNETGDAASLRDQQGNRLRPGRRAAVRGG